MFNTKKNASIKFNILNLVKPGSLFEEGLQPVAFSEKLNTLDGTEWKREGFNIKYIKSSIARDGTRDKSYYNLTFTYTF